MSIMNLPVQMDRSATDAAEDAAFEAEVDQVALELEALLREQRARPFLSDEEQHHLSHAIGALLQLYLPPPPVPTWRP